MKLELIEWLAGLKDKAIVTSLFNIKQANEAEDLHIGLTTEKKDSIARGLEDAEAGRVLSSEEMWKRYGRTKKG